MERLSEIREELDAIDRQIVEFYNRRMDLCEEIGEYKARKNLPVPDEKREQEILDKLENLMLGDIRKTGIRNIYKEIFVVSRKLQVNKKSLICSIKE